MKKIFLMLVLLIAQNLYAHGEDKYGPNNGIIRMPGTFHTELVLFQNENSYFVFLLDVSNKNSTNKDSSVQLRYQNKTKIINFICVPDMDHFTCETKEKIDAKNGQLIISAIRKSNKGTDAIYDLPLSLKK
jgi:hypothetical protein